MTNRYISPAFGEKLLREGTILNKFRQQNGDGSTFELIFVQYTNGVEFVVFCKNGKVEQVSA